MTFALACKYIHFKGVKSKKIANALEIQGLGREWN